MHRYMVLVSINTMKLEMFSYCISGLCFSIFIIYQLILLSTVTHFYLDKKFNGHLSGNIKRWKNVFPNDSLNQNEACIRLGNNTCYICKSRLRPFGSRLVLFTSMYYNPNKMFIYNNTLNLWAQLIPAVKPVLFLSRSDWNNAFNVHMSHGEIKWVDFISRACDNGWDVLSNNNYISENKHNYIVLKDCFNFVMEKYKSIWYGFANGDVLFDWSLLKTLDFIQENKLLLHSQLLVMGRRYDYKIQQNQSISTIAELSLISRNATLHAAIGHDYFISTKEGFKWKDIPAFIIGRPIFDNWLVWFASSFANITDIDATGTILLIHQSLHPKDGWMSVSSAAGINTKLAKQYSKNFNKHLGVSSCISHAMVKENISNRLNMMKNTIKVVNEKCVRTSQHPFDGRVEK